MALPILFWTAAGGNPPAEDDDGSSRQIENESNAK